MIADLAKEDLKSLRQCGHNPTDEDVIKLNDLALRIEKGKDTTPQNCPRIAFAGNTVLHEPTIMSELWWIDYGKDAFLMDKWRLRTYFFMLANATNEALKDLTIGRDIRGAVKEWARSTTATDNELWRALMWVQYADLNAHEPTEKEVEQILQDEKTRNSLWMTLIACAGSLGTTPSELETQTPSALNSLLVQANLMARIPMKPSVARDYIAYRKLLKSIEERENGRQQT